MRWSITKAHRNWSGDPYLLHVRPLAFIKLKKSFHSTIIAAISSSRRSTAEDPLIVMANYNSSSVAAGLSFWLLFLCLFTSGGNFVMGNGQKTWCVAKPSSDQATLLANINYACSQVDCQILHRGCPCFSPDNLMNHASIAMNLYYQSRGRNHWNCDFRNSGLIVVTDPSYANCIYA